jgi:hypothetical protein
MITIKDVKHHVGTCRHCGQYAHAFRSTQPLLKLLLANRKLLTLLGALGTCSKVYNLHTLTVTRSLYRHTRSQFNRSFGVLCE